MQWLTTWTNKTQKNAVPIQLRHLIRGQILGATDPVFVEERLDSLCDAADALTSKIAEHNKKFEEKLETHAEKIAEQSTKFNEDSRVWALAEVQWHQSLEHDIATKLAEHRAHIENTLLLMHGEFASRIESFEEKFAAATAENRLMASLKAWSHPSRLKVGASRKA